MVKRLSTSLQIKYVYLLSGVASMGGGLIYAVRWGLIRRIHLIETQASPEAFTVYSRM